MLNDLGRRVRDGATLHAGDTVSNRGGDLDVGFVEVHPLLWEGPLFVTWLDYYEDRGLAPHQRALQVVLPEPMTGPGPQRWQRCCREADCLVGYPEDDTDRHPQTQHRRRIRRSRH